MLFTFKKPAIFLFIAFLCFSAVSQVNMWLFLLFVVDATATVAIFPELIRSPLSLTHTIGGGGNRLSYLSTDWPGRWSSGVFSCVLVPNVVVPSPPRHFEPGKRRVSSHGQGVTNSSKKAEYTTGGFSPSVPLFNLALKLNNSTTQSWMPRKKKVALPLPFCTAPKKIKVSFFFIFCAMLLLIMDFLTIIHTSPENPILNYCQIELG